MDAQGPAAPCEPSPDTGAGLPAPADPLASPSTPPSAPSPRLHPPPKIGNEGLDAALRRHARHEVSRGEKRRRKAAREGGDDAASPMAAEACLAPIMAVLPLPSGVRSLLEGSAATGRMDPFGVLYAPAADPSLPRGGEGPPPASNRLLGASAQWDWDAIAFAEHSADAMAWMALSLRMEHAVETWHEILEGVDADRPPAAAFSPAVERAWVLERTRRRIVVAAGFLGHLALTCGLAGLDRLRRAAAGDDEKERLRRANHRRWSLPLDARVKGPLIEAVREAVRIMAEEYGRLERIRRTRPISPQRLFRVRRDAAAIADRPSLFSLYLRTSKALTDALAAVLEVPYGHDGAVIAWTDSDRTCIGRAGIPEPFEAESLVPSPRHLARLRPCVRERLHPLLPSNLTEDCADDLRARAESLSHDPIGLFIRRRRVRPYGDGRHAEHDALAVSWHPTIPRAWLGRVFLRGLAVLDGRALLDARPIPSSGLQARTDLAAGPLEAWEAVWVRKGAGASAHVESGVLVRRTQPSGAIDVVQGDDLQAALSALRRRDAARAASRRWAPPSAPCVSRSDQVTGSGSAAPLSGNPAPPNGVRIEAVGHVDGPHFLFPTRRFPDGTRKISLRRGTGGLARLDEEQQALDRLAWVGQPPPVRPTSPPILDERAGEPPPPRPAFEFLNLDDPECGECLADPEAGADDDDA